MSQNFETILILGATSGIGEAFARRFHAQGKKVIAAGRRLERLQKLQSELKGLEIAQIDLLDFANLESKLSALTKKFPTLDTVFVMSGILNYLSFKDPSTSTNADIINEVGTNVTGPMLVSRLLVPHFLSLSKPAALVFISSGMAYIPIPLYPVYCPTKAAIHHFAITLRGQLDGTNVSVIELAAPYVDTEIDASIRGKSGNQMQPMPLDEYMDSAMKGLEEREDGKPKKEIAVGFSQIGVDTWRGAFGPILKQFGVEK
ncbi:hypothetical protein F5884DRAFT_58448 [Xylogone sp. PMI_703]|nr:hypothetical protein F5884DRAFT_58448 [Xylogone sp. PMI_703]